MKKISLFSLLFLLSLTQNISAQTIPCDKFLSIIKTNDFQKITKIINGLGFNLQSIQKHIAGDKGIESGGKSVYWSYNCEYNKYSGTWSTDSDIYWSFLRLLIIEDINAVWDITLNSEFCKDYIEDFKIALKDNGFNSEIDLDEQSGSIVTTFFKQEYRYMISIKQYKDNFMISFFSLDAKL